MLIPWWLLPGEPAVYQNKNGHEAVDDILSPGTLGISTLPIPYEEQIVPAQSPVEALWFDAVTVQKVMVEDQVFADNINRLFRE